MGWDGWVGWDCWEGKVALREGTAEEEPDAFVPRGYGSARGEVVGEAEDDDAEFQVQEGKSGKAVGGLS